MQGIIIMKIVLEIHNLVVVSDIQKTNWGSDKVFEEHEKCTFYCH